MKLAGSRQSPRYQSHPDRGEPAMGDAPVRRAAIGRIHWAGQGVELYRTPRRSRVSPSRIRTAPIHPPAGRCRPGASHAGARSPASRTSCLASPAAAEPHPRPESRRLQASPAGSIPGVSIADPETLPDVPVASAAVNTSTTPASEKSPYSGLAGPVITRSELMPGGDRMLQSE